MKIILFFICFSVNYGISQSQWKDFYLSINEVETPFKIDSTTFLPNVLISKKNALKYLFIPASTINLKKEDSLKYDIDTALISLYYNWNSLNLDKKDTIDIYSPDGNGGLIYCSQRFRLNQKFNGIIWSYHRNMGKEIGLLYPYGIEHWLFIYDNYGNCSDFIQIAKKLSNYSCEQCLDYKLCEINAFDNRHILNLSFNYETNTLKGGILDIFEGNPTYLKEKTKELWVLTKKGKFVRTKP